MISRLLSLIVLQLVLSGSPSFQAAEAGEFISGKMLLAEIDAISPRMEVEIALYREWVQAGNEADGWTKEQKAAALNRIEEVVAPSSEISPDAPFHDRFMTRKINEFIFDSRSRQAGDPNKPPRNLSELNLWLAIRLHSLMSVRSLLQHRYCGELIDYAETVWLRAKAPEDFKPVALALTALKERVPQFFLSSDFAMPMGRGHPFPSNNPAFAQVAEFTRVRNETFEAYVLMAPEKPFILPDPETDPKKFWKTRKAIYWLCQIDFTFLKKPRMEAHLGVLNFRFRKALTAARELAERLIFRDAPVDEIASAMERLHSFEEKELNIIADPPRTLEVDPRLPSYQEVIARNTRGNVSMRNVRYETDDEKREAEGLSTTLKLGDLWLKFLRAQKAEESRKAISDLRELLQKMSTPLSEAVKLHIEQHSLPPPVSEANPTVQRDATPAEPDPVKALIVELERAAKAAAPSTHRDDPEAGDPYAAQAVKAAENLVTAWRTFSRTPAKAGTPNQPSGEIVEDHGADWQTLMQQPGSLHLLALRSRAAKKVMEQIVEANPHIS